MAKILYAEDDNDLASLIIHFLTTQSHVVERVVSGLDALEHLEFENYDIAILDNKLSDMDGIKVCETFRSKNGTTPIVLLTGSNDPGISEHGIKAGANKVFFKPAELVTIAACIKELTAGK